MAGHLHRRLRRQLEECFGDSANLPESLEAFVSMVDDAYQEAEIDRKLSGKGGLEALDLDTPAGGVGLAVQPAPPVAATCAPGDALPLDALPDVVFLTDEAGVILDCRGGDPKDLVSPRERLVGKRITACPHGNIGERFGAAIEAARATGKKVSIEYTLPCADGPAQFDASIVATADGRILASIRNSTQRAEAVSKARRRELEYRSLVNSVDAAILLIDPKSRRIVEANRRTIAFYQTTRERLITSSFDELFDDTSKVPDLAAIAMKTDATRAEAHHRLHDGRVALVEMRLSAVTFRGRRIVLAVHRELDSTLGEQPDARNSVSMLKATFDATADGILVVDPHGKLVTFNRLFSEMWRIPQELLQPGREQDAASKALAQLKNPAKMVERLRQINAAVDARSTEVVELIDGRFFDCVSMPQLIGGEIAGRVWSFRDVTDRQQTQEKIRYHAYHDSLTGLPNRTLFQDRLAQNLAQSRRARRDTALLLIDLDRFKTINDTLGHDAGDSLLIEVARRLETRARDGDTIARLGGDEFVFLISDLRHKEDAAVVAEQVLDVLKPPIQIHEHDLHISASIGIAIFPDDGEGGASLMKSADVALYRAKELGRNNYQIYEPKLSQRAMERLVMEKDLRQAIHDHEFILQYQPQYELKTGKMTGVEALIRWVRDGAVVPPDKFIPIAEECGLVVPLGRWVLEEAVRSCAEFNRLSPEPLRTCVNLSAMQIQRPNFANEVSQVLQEHGLATRHLVLELTESALMQNPELGSYAMAQLEQMGVGLAMDDFGTGHSSLSHVSHLPIAMIKIDKSFVKNCAKRKTDATILAAIVTMGHALGLKVLAEGVETEDQAQVLLDQGCDEVQGYLYSRPLPAKHLIELLKR